LDFEGVPYPTPSAFTANDKRAQGSTIPTLNPKLKSKNQWWVNWWVEMKNAPEGAFLLA
jgi:hypothetical protein